MLETFYPDRMERSAWEIDYEALWEQGFRGILFDIDNTLALHGGPPLPETLALFERLSRLGFAVCLVSNNKEERVRSFAEAVGARFLYKAGKPGRRGYGRAVALLGVGREETVSVGDQLFTDIWGAKRAGIYSILVEPIDPHEEIQIVLKRYLEKIVLHFYKKQLRKAAI